MFEERGCRRVFFPDGLFQPCRSCLYPRDSHVACDPLYGMCDAFGQLAVATLQSIADLNGRIALLLRKLIQQIQIQPLITGDTFEAVGRTDARYIGDDECRSDSLTCFTGWSTALARGFAHRANVVNSASGSIGLLT